MSTFYSSFDRTLYFKTMGFTLKHVVNPGADGVMRMNIIRIHEGYFMKVIDVYP